MPEKEPRSIDPGVKELLELMGESPESDYRDLLEKMNGGMLALLIPPTPFNEEKSFGGKDVKDVLDRIREGTVRIFTDKYGRVGKYSNKKFVIIPEGDVNRPETLQIPQLLIVNAVMSEGYSIIEANGIAIISN